MPNPEQLLGDVGRACRHAQLLGFSAVVLGPPREAILGNVLWAPQLERRSPAGPTPQRWARRYLRVFKGMEVSLMATITPPWSRYRMWCSSSNTCREVGGSLRRVGHCSGLGVARWGAELSTCKLGASAEASSLSQGWSEGSPCPQAIPMPSHSPQA